MTAISNVLAGRYASAELRDLWSPEHKVVAERQLWIAVMKAQRDLGVDIPDGASRRTRRSSTRSTWSRSPRASGSPATT